MSDAIIADVIAHPLTQTMTRPTTTSWGTYNQVSMVLVEVRTDAGITGIGETLARFAPLAYARVIEDLLKPRLVGQPVSTIAAHWQVMRRALSGRSGGMLIEAIAGIDIALWDIMGKQAGLPIAQMLGGMNRSEIEVYAAAVNWVGDSEADAELDRLLAKGFTKIKIKLAHPVQASCRRIERMRKRAGDSVGLCVDANWAYDLDEATEVSRALAENGYSWFEEPLRPEDELGYEALRRRSDVPLAAGESNYSVDQARRLVANRTLSVLQPDVARAGGITETQRMALLADAFDVAYAPHIGMSGIVCETASVHLSAAMPNFRVMECEGDESPFKVQIADLRPACLRQHDGKVSVPRGPGLGLEIDWDAVAHLRCR